MSYFRLPTRQKTPTSCLAAAIEFTVGELAAAASSWAEPLEDRFIASLGLDRDGTTLNKAVGTLRHYAELAARGELPTEIQHYFKIGPSILPYFSVILVDASWPEHAEWVSKGASRRGAVICLPPRQWGNQAP